MKLSEFQNIMPIANIPTVLTHGILSHVEAAKLAHRSVAEQQVQDIRDQKAVPQGQPLHEYANAYFHARNPMMSKRRTQAGELCVLRISTEILKLPGVVITDQNAASNYARFYPPKYLDWLDLDTIFAANWKHPGNQIEEWRHSSAKCAEVLVPEAIAPEFILGAYVVSADALTRLQGMEFALPIEIDPDLFFH